MMRARARLFAIGAGIACVLVLMYLGVRLGARIKERWLLSRLDQGSDEACGRIVDALLALGPDVFPAIIDCLERGSSRRRLWCLHAVGEARRKDLLPLHLMSEVGEAMIKCGSDANPEVRDLVLQVADTVSLTGLASFSGLLASEQDGVRLIGYRILGQDVLDPLDPSPPPRSIEPLLPIVLRGLKDRQSVVRTLAGSILARCDWMAGTVVQALMNAYAREVSREVRASFLDDLGHLGPLAGPAVPLLRQVVETHWSGREAMAASRALARIREVEESP